MLLKLIYFYQMFTIPHLKCKKHFIYISLFQELGRELLRGLKSSTLFPPGYCTPELSSANTVYAKGKLSYMNEDEKVEKLFYPPVHPSHVKIHPTLSYGLRGILTLQFLPR